MPIYEDLEFKIKIPDVRRQIETADGFTQAYATIDLLKTLQEFDENGNETGQKQNYREAVNSETLAKIEAEFNHLVGAALNALANEAAKNTRIAELEAALATALEAL